MRLFFYFYMYCYRVCFAIFLFAFFAVESGKRMVNYSKSLDNVKSKLVILQQLHLILSRVQRKITFIRFESFICKAKNFIDLVLYIIVFSVLYWPLYKLNFVRAL